MGEAMDLKKKEKKPINTVPRGRSVTFPFAEVRCRERNVSPSFSH